MVHVEPYDFVDERPDGGALADRESKVVNGAAGWSRVTEKTDSI